MQPDVTLSLVFPMFQLRPSRRIASLLQQYWSLNHAACVPSPISRPEMTRRMGPRRRRRRLRRQKSVIKGSLAVREILAAKFITSTGQPDGPNPSFVVVDPAAIWPLDARYVRTVKIDQEPALSVIPSTEWMEGLSSQSAGSTGRLANKLPRKSMHAIEDQTMESTLTSGRAMSKKL